LYKELDNSHNAGLSLPKKTPQEKSILIVDDHPEIRYHLREILEDNYHIIEAAHGLEALDILNSKKIDLIISDLMMPWMDGFELLKAINVNEDFRKIPILVVSARISDEDQQKVLDEGVNDYLKKPFHKTELISRINNMLDRRERFEQNVDVFSLLSDKQNNGSYETDILAKVESLVMARIGDSNLSVFDLADAMAASERQVYRLMKDMTGLTPLEYITEIRLKYADYLMRKGKVRNATEAAKSIGINNVTTFNKQYEKKFGVKPSTLF
jgi:CheY-like chemotaxis protein